MTLRRFTLDEWRGSPLAARRVDLGGTEEQAAAVREICRAVARGGDAAVIGYGARFDGWEPGPGETLRVPDADVRAAAARLTAAQRSALDLAASRIETFHRAQRFDAVVGDALQLRTGPVRRAGLYVPGGRAAYPSTVLMTAIPARVAGVADVALATPPGPDGAVPDAVLAAAGLAGVAEVYRMGGAQAIAAFAYGTASVPRVDVVAGPGNIYVTLAKREVFGAVGVDGVAGPTEIMVVADGGARADLVAADLASQLEHDPMAWAVLVTDSAALLDAVEESFADLAPRLERAEVVAAAHCHLVLAPSLEDAVDAANEFGPEHLEVVSARADELVELVENAGAVFVGEHAPVSLGDYVIGPNHTLPTAQAARFSSPLGVHTFLKRRSVARVGADEFAALEGAARTLAELEGLPAHAYALEIRRGSD